MLRAALDELARRDPPLARQVVAHLPQPGPRLVARLLAAVAARDKAHSGTLIGESLAQRLAASEAGTVIARALGEASPQTVQRADGDWKGYILPVWQEGDLHALRLLVRDDDQASPEVRDEAGSRFMLELTLAVLGPLRLAGLFRKRRLSVVLNTRHALPEAMRHDIAALFGASTSALDIAGELGFRADGKLVLPLVEPEATVGLSV